MVVYWVKCKKSSHWSNEHHVAIACGIRLIHPKRNTKCMNELFVVILCAVFYHRCNVRLLAQLSIRITLTWQNSHFIKLIDYSLKSSLACDLITDLPSNIILRSLCDIYKRMKMVFVWCIWYIDFAIYFIFCSIVFLNRGANFHWEWHLVDMVWQAMLLLWWYNCWSTQPMNHMPSKPGNFIGPSLIKIKNVTLLDK